jgi:hypothetical protein
VPKLVQFTNLGLLSYNSQLSFVSKTKGSWNWNLEPGHLVAKTMKMSILDVECCCILKSIPQSLESWRKDNWLSEESSNWFESLSWYDRFPGNAKGSNNSPAQARQTSSLIKPQSILTFHLTWIHNSKDPSWLFNINQKSFSWGNLKTCQSDQGSRQTNL